MEPRRKLEDWELNDLDGESDDSTESESERKRIGNAYWCVCGGKCKAMETYAESLCCQKTNDIPENYFQGQSCISLSADFKIVCLTRAVLETALSAMNNLRGDKLVINNSAAERQQADKCYCKSVQRKQLSEESSILSPGEMEKHMWKEKHKPVWWPEHVSFVSRILVPEKLTDRLWQF
eukprot:gene5747-11008_t